MDQLCRADAAMNEHLRIIATEGGASEKTPSHAAIDTFDTDDEDSDGMGLPFRYSRTAPATDQLYRTAFRHAICLAKQSEQSAYDSFVSGDADVPEGESPDHYVASCKLRHAACRMCGDGPMYLLKEDRGALRVDLNVLGVCRQLYEEGNHLLWATNTFSFEDPKTFGKFFGSLNPAQKRKLSKIHISTDIGGLSSYHSSAYQRARWDSTYWGKGLKIANLNMLRGVQTLHLCLQQAINFIPRTTILNAGAEDVIKSALDPDMEIILRLRALSVKHVTVVVSDDPAKLNKLDGRDLRWTVVKKNEYAESIRAQLVDPDGAELVKAEAEAANLVRKTEIRDSAVARLKTYKRILREKRTDMIQAARWASRAEAKAAAAAKEATQLSSKSWKKATQLQNTADEEREAALDARAIADSRALREKSWEEEVANAREKLKRAMARLGATPEEIEDEEELEKLIESSDGSEMDSSEDDVTQDHESTLSEDEDNDFNWYL